MASSQEFVEYVAEQLREAGTITYRKMFGEYGVYCDGKICVLVCDDQVFLKITEAGRKMCPEAEAVPPYSGAKPYLLIEDIDDHVFAGELVRKTCDELPEPKPKKPKAKKQ